jgi:hypothetical protein
MTTRPRVFFATPCYRSDPHLALGWAHHTVKALGLEGATVSAPVSPFLTTSQAQILAQFVAGSCSHLFFREDDVFVQPEVLARMLAAKVPAIVAPYLVRDTERLETTVDAHGDVLSAGLGCALLERVVIETLSAQHYEALHYRQDDRELVDLTAEYFVELEGVRRKIKGDHAFWHRVRQAGYRVAVLEDVIVDHAGQVSHFRPRVTPVDGMRKRETP